MDVTKSISIMQKPSSLVHGPSQQLITNNIERILLDCDGVLSNFVLHVIVSCKLKMTYDMWNSWNAYEAFMTKEELYSITNNTRFWLSIPKYSWARLLVNIVDSIGIEWRICTTPMNPVYFCPARITWLEKELGISEDKIIFCKDKHWFANEKTLLIDDNESNINAFQDAGGSTISFLQPWNLSGFSHEDVMIKLQELKKIKNV